MRLQTQSPVIDHRCDQCGPERIRTADLTRARGALYQLSYRPLEATTV